MSGRTPSELDALKAILQDMELDAYGPDPGGFEDWIPALTAWAVDESERLDAATLAKRVSQIWEVGNLVEKELSPRFSVRATAAATFPYHDERGELQAGVVGVHKLDILSDDPRELACAVAAAVHREALARHNVVLFRKLIRVDSPMLHSKDPFSARRPVYVSCFGLARVAK